jgi:hypothetical protein
MKASFVPNLPKQRLAFSGDTNMPGTYSFSTAYGTKPISECSTTKAREDSKPPASVRMDAL